MILLDTSAVLAYFERFDPAVGPLLRESRGVAGSTTVLGELHYGVLTASSTVRLVRQRTLDLYRRLARMETVPPDAVAEAFSRLCAEVPPRKNPTASVGVNDRWVVAESVALGARLVTFDDRQAALARAVYGEASCVLLAAAR